MRRTRIFTLVELLVVIAVTAILAGLLLPALKKSKDTALRSICANSLRQYGQAIYMYVNDNGEFVPPSYLLNYFGAGYHEMWFHALIDTGYHNKSLGESSGGVGCCLSNPRQYDNEWGYWFNYSANSNILLLNTAMKIMQVREPTGKIAILDGYPDSDTTCIYITSGPWAYPACIHAYPHNDGLNVLFFDAHVNWFGRRDFCWNSGNGAPSYSSWWLP